MLGQLTGKDEADRGLDLSGGNGGLLVVRSELASLSCDALEDVWDENVLESNTNETRRDWSGILPLTKELRIDMARLEIPVSGWTCFRTGRGALANELQRWRSQFDT